ncbi:MAG TPA: DUF4388 domain-containing protein [Desulfomonilaceae bacterium]|nr:DUF4388 domain-containing protein [Desulfomonilaceae bacterium]
MTSDDKKVVTIGSRVASYIGSKATKERKMQAAAMQAEFTLRDTLVILCYLARDPDADINRQARRNLIAAARSWFNRPDRPELPEPIHQIVTQVVGKVGLAEESKEFEAGEETVTGNIGLLGLGEIIQTIDHNHRTARIMMQQADDTAMVYTEKGKVVGARLREADGLEALYEIFGWIEAAFIYVHADPGEFRNRINVSTLNLVMDALERTTDRDPFEIPISRTWKVTGHLKIMNLFEIAEIFEMNSKQAVCRLKQDGEEGFLYFRNSRIINASLGDMSGMDAACSLFTWPSAFFEIFRGGEDVEEVIHIGMQNLIIEAMRLLDEGVTVTDRVASELALVDELFDGRDVIALPILEKVRLVFSEDERAREVLETDSNPLVRKALKVKISKTVYRYLNPATDHDQRLKAARGVVPLSTTEKLVLLSYLSHDESQEIREQAKNTLTSLDISTYRKGLGADLHPSVMDFLIRETIRDESLVKVAAASDNILEETALHILETWQSPELFHTVLENRRLRERSPAVISKLATACGDDPVFRKRIETLEESMLQGDTDMKVEGPLAFFGLGGLLRAARQGGRSGTIILESPSRVARVFFKRGKIVGAVSGPLEGIPAVEAIMDTRDFRFRYLLRTYFAKENLDPLVADEMLNTQGAGPDPVLPQSTGSTLVTGNLATMDIFEVLSGLEGTPEPIAVSVICEEGSGEIRRDRSRIFDVQVEGIDDPQNAMASLLSWTGLRFIVRRALADQPARLDKSLNDFYTEVLRLIPEDVIRMASPGHLPEWELSEAEFESLYHRILQMGVGDKIKLALFGTKEARDLLVRDPNKIVALTVVKSPKILESEIETISKSRHVCEDVLRHIAGSKEWMRSYSIKTNLAFNAKTPVPIAMRLLPQLREGDLWKLAKSKNVSQVLAKQAGHLAQAKSPR